MSVLHLLHGWSDGDETTGQPQHRSTRQHHSAIDRRHQHRSTSSANNIYRHLPVLHHRHLHLYYYIRYHHQPVHRLRHSFLWIIGVNTIKITHSDYLHGLPIYTISD